MSITITTDVFCDVCGMAWTHGTTGPRPDARQARAQAKSQGWRRRRGHDVCPDCGLDAEAAS